MFALGDASDLPTSRTGAAVRKQAPVLVENLLAVMEGRAPTAKYDGYASCPLTTAYGKPLLAEFDHDGKPTPSLPLIDTRKERHDMWLLKKYGLPRLYWKLMLRGRAWRGRGSASAGVRVYNPRSGDLAHALPTAPGPSRGQRRMMMVLGVTASLFIGVLLGLLGGGGSILTVPLLVYVFGVEPRTAIAVSLLVVGLTSASAVVVHARAGRVRWRTALVFGAGGMVGAFLGGRLARLLPSWVLLLLFTGVMVAAAVTMLRRKEAPASGGTGSGAEPVRLPVPRVLAQGLAVGLLSGLVGAGGGFLIVPALVLVGLPTPAAMATSLVVISLQCAAGLLGHLGHTRLPWELTLAVLATAIGGSFLGGRLAGHIPPGTLRKGFAWFVLATASFMLLAQTPPELRARAALLLATPWPWLGLVGVSAVTVAGVRATRPTGGRPR